MLDYLLTRAAQAEAGPRIFLISARDFPLISVSPLNRHSSHDSGCAVPFGSNVRRTRTRRPNNCVDLRQRRTHGTRAPRRPSSQLDAKAIILIHSSTRKPSSSFTARRESHHPRQGEALRCPRHPARRQCGYAQRAHLVRIGRDRACHASHRTRRPAG